MIRRLLDRFRTATPPAGPDYRPGRTVYAVGDIHGRDDLLKRMLALIEADRTATPVHDPLLVLLGDYIDRGEESAAVLRRLAALADAPTIETHFLRGNHDAAMLDFLDDPVGGRHWLGWGGLATLYSFGVGNVTETSDAATLMRAGRELRDALGHIQGFLRKSLETRLKVGNLFFCHAAIDPDLPLDAQEERALLWGHPAFLKRGGPSGACVIHGHTITDAPEIGPNRIGIDTGAYYSGKLTAARLDDGTVRFIST